MNNQNQADQLPPHAPEAERGLLGCLLLDGSQEQRPVEALNAVRERFQGEKVFYSLPHEEIFRAIGALADAGKPWDIIHLVEELKTAGTLDQVGGIAELSTLPDAVPSAANWPHYLELVWEKYLARLQLQASQSVIHDIMEHSGITEALAGRMQRQREELDKRMERGSVTPRYLARPQDFADDILRHLVGDPAAPEPGLELPIHFPLRIRPKETTLVYGDDGAGKSTLILYLLLHLASHPGQKLFIASMEMPKDVTLWMMAGMLLGKRRVPDSQTGMAEAVAAVGWLNKRVVVYDFLGIADWRELLDTARYAARNLGCTQFLIDSVMRIGIADDDYAQQGFCASAFANFAMKENAHLWHVMHENKSKDSGHKGNIRGSKLWSANACNVVRIERDSKKGEKVDEARADYETTEKRDNHTQDELDGLQAKIASLHASPDSYFKLQKQRFPGTRQNGSKGLWFDPDSYQFRVQVTDTLGVNYLERWKRKAKPSPNGDGANHQDTETQSE